MNEPIMRIRGNLYGINLAYQIPEMSCWNCGCYSRTKRTCGMVLARNQYGQKATQTRYSVCLRDGPKALWRPRLGEANG